ncbi:MAG: efflux RND transporter periplasmic adaptor subunit [Thiogranum sp.]
MFGQPLNPTLLSPWLDLQCRMIGGTVRGVVLLPVKGKGGMGAAACWPETQAGDLLLAAALGGHIESTGQIEALPAQGQRATHHMVACPIHLGRDAVGVVAIEVAQEDRAGLEAALQLLQWGGHWLELLVRQHGRQQDAGKARLLKQLALLLGGQDRQVWIDNLADSLHCVHVALARRQGRRWRLEKLSGKRDFDARSQQARLLAEQIAAGLAGPASVRKEHLLVALKDNNGRASAGLLLVRPVDKPFSSAERNWCEQLALFAGPVLALARAAEPGLFGRFAQRAGRGMRLLLGAGHVRFKATAIALTVVAALALLVPVSYRISAPASLEGRIQRAVVAPRDGFIKSAQARPGDTVLSGQPVALLETRELELEQDKWRNQLAQFRKAYRQARADHARADARIMHARMAQAEAELALTRAHLQRSELQAPIDGIVVSGDLTQALGAPVTRGDVLFEIAPLDDYRVVLRIDDRDIATVAEGQRGVLALNGLPDQQLAFTVARITPVSEVVNGRNSFRVEAVLETRLPALRPGMTGTGKVEAGQRSLLWMLSHRMIDWLRLQAWVLWF